MELCEESVIHPEALARARATLDSSRVDEMADTFRVLGDRTRVGILMALSEGELCVCDLAELFRVTPSAISHQLRLLRAHRLVRPRRKGKLMYYSLDDDHVRTLFAEGMRHVEEASR